MDVKTAGRTLDLIEVFASERRPLSLSELARAINAPVSSCYALVRTLEHRGYLQSLNARRSLYPTKRLLRNAERIAEHDPLTASVWPVLRALADKTDETILLGRRAGGRIAFVEVIESTRGVRYSAGVGDTHPLHASAMGKAILSRLAPADYAAALGEMRFTRVTGATLTSRAAFERDLRACASRGWYENRGENAADILALAVPVRIDDQLYAVAVAGPLSRVDRALDRNVKALLAAQRQVDACTEDSTRAPRREARRIRAAAALA